MDNLKGKSIIKMYDYHAWANDVIINRIKELLSSWFFLDCKGLDSYLYG